MQVLPALSLRSRMLLFESVMVVSELAVLIGTVCLQMYDMTVESELEGYGDMRSYAVLCGISTFGCLATTLSSLALSPLSASRSSSSWMRRSMSTS